MPTIQLIPTPNNDIFESSGLTPEQSVTDSEERTMPLLDESKHPCTVNPDGTYGVCNCECFDEPHKGHPGIDYPRTGGIFVYLVGHKHPAKGFPTPSAVTNNNYIKESVNSQIRFLTRHPWMLIGFLWRPLKTIEDWILEQNRIFSKIMGTFKFQDRFFSKAPKAIKNFISTFLIEIGVRDDYSREFGKLFATLLEYDNAHLWRVQDIALVTTAELLHEDLAKELKKILRALGERDNRAHLIAKYENYANLLKWIIKVPKFKRAFHKALDSIDFTDIQMDEADRYHTLAKSGYKFGGRTVEDRTEEWIKIHEGILPPRTRVQKVENNVITQGINENFATQEYIELQRKTGKLQEAIQAILNEARIDIVPTMVNSEQGSFPAISLRSPEGVSIITNFQ